MSWFNALLPFAAGFIKGFADEYNRSAPAAGTPSPGYSGGFDYSDFPSRMTAFGQAAGLGAPTFRNRSAIFAVPVRGGSYPVIFTAGHGIVIASACSRLEFPYGLPAELRPVIDRLNAKITTGCLYEVAEDESGAAFSSTTRCALHELTQPVFEALLQELAFRIAALDRVLTQNGFAV